MGRTSCVNLPCINRYAKFKILVLKILIDLLVTQSIQYDFVTKIEEQNIVSNNLN